MSKTEGQIGKEWYSLPRWARICLIGIFTARFAMANVCVVQCWVHTEPCCARFEAPRRGEAFRDLRNGG